MLWFPRISSNKTSKTALTQFARVSSIGGVMNHVPPGRRVLRQLEIDRLNDLDSSLSASKN
jgi:hypothetical protein